MQFLLKFKFIMMVWIIFTGFESFGLYSDGWKKRIALINYALPPHLSTTQQSTPGIYA